jgi:hypothetical protein
VSEESYTDDFQFERSTTTLVTSNEDSPYSIVHTDKIIEEDYPELENMKKKICRK